MPSRAYTSLLLSVWQLNLLKRLGTCQCPLGLIPHCYAENFKKMVDNAELVSMPSRAYTSLLLEFVGTDHGDIHVSMPSRAYTSLLRRKRASRSRIVIWCQCPLGLIPHCYDDAMLVSVKFIAGVNALSGLYLIVTYFATSKTVSGKLYVSMPSRAYTSLLHPVHYGVLQRHSFVSMPSRAYTSLLRLKYQDALSAF